MNNRDKSYSLINQNCIVNIIEFPRLRKTIRYYLSSITVVAFACNFQVLNLTTTILSLYYSWKTELYKRIGGK